MAEKTGKGASRQLEIRHLGRLQQIGIYFGKFIRMFIYQSDWKVLPMAALIAGLVGFALGRDFGVNMEGTLTCAFAIVCVCIWNGSFNSIQVICRERGVVKREHRSGMYISSYILAHLMYQLLLCLLQSAVTLLVLGMVGMKFEGEGLFTRWMVLDAGITVLLITYAADLMSLWISSLVRSTTTAMTIMPFLLIFQLIFSGGFFALPEAAKPIELLTISNPGLKAMAAQTKLNDLPYSAVNKMMELVDSVEIGGRLTVGQAIALLQDEKNPLIRELRAVRLGEKATVREILEDFLKDERYREVRDRKLILNVSVGDAVTALTEAPGMDKVLDREVGVVTSLGDVIDFLASDEYIQSISEEGVDLRLTVGDAMDLAGRDEIMRTIEESAARTMHKPEYDYKAENILMNWLHIALFIVVFALLSIITLEFIDKDKR